MGKSYYEHLSGRIDADDIKLGWCDGITVLECVKAHSTRPHTHPHTEMIFCIKGKFTYRIDGIGEVSFGAGMGLPNIKKYTDDMQIETETGKGTTVILTIML